MKCFCFVVHHECSYVDGMLVVAADSYGAAMDIIRNAKKKDLRRVDQQLEFSDTWGEDLAFKEEAVMFFDSYPGPLDKEKHDYRDVWYLYHTLKDEDTKAPGIIAFAYHDG